MSPPVEVESDTAAVGPGVGADGCGGSPELRHKKMLGGRGHRCSSFSVSRSRAIWASV
jgi:hypothetical protein